MTTIMIAGGLARPAAPRPLEGQVAIVTAAGVGAGPDVAAALATRGAMLVINGAMRPAAAAALCRRLGKAHDVPVLFDDADPFSPQGAGAMMERAHRAFGPASVLVNNMALIRCEAAAWDAAFTRALAAAAHATAAVLPQMAAHGRGRIVNLGPVEEGAAHLARSRLIGLTRMTARAAAGIACNAICPVVRPGAPAPVAEIVAAVCLFSAEAIAVTGGAFAVGDGWMAPEALLPRLR
ncbi:MAG TPA: SDR family NAD(P)-dependent oxidoreductase [Acetobacteraceae bacterium]|nr:SDR family NAD(P)-dependent oxidoreductase [Acetobacteraceae bacterium]